LLRKINLNTITGDSDRTGLLEFSELNGCLISFYLIKGESCWYASEQSDRFIMLLKGNLEITLENDLTQLEENEGVIISKGTLYKPETTDTALILVIESKPVFTFINTYE